MAEHIQLGYVAQMKNTEEWLDGLVTYIEGRISATKENPPTAEGIEEALTFATQSLAAIQGQRGTLLELRDTKFDTQARKDDATRVIRECRRAEAVIKQWLDWLNYQSHRLSRLRDEDSLPPE